MNATTLAARLRARPRSPDLPARSRAPTSGAAAPGYRASRRRIGAGAGAWLLGWTRRKTLGGIAIPLAVVVAIVLFAGLIAAAGPARRGLRIQPMEALRQD